VSFIYDALPSRSQVWTFVPDPHHQVVDLGGAGLRP